jgi:hypothetical protein
MRHPRLRGNLSELRTNLRGDLGLHQLPRDQHDRVAHETLKPTIPNLRDDIGSRHPLTFDHRGVSFSTTLW